MRFHLVSVLGNLSSQIAKTSKKFSFSVETGKILSCTVCSGWLACCVIFHQSFIGMFISLSQPIQGLLPNYLYCHIYQSHDGNYCGSNLSLWSEQIEGMVPLWTELNAKLDWKILKAENCNCEFKMIKKKHLDDLHLVLDWNRFWPCEPAHWWTLNLGDSFRVLFARFSFSFLYVSFANVCTLYLKWIFLVQVHKGI